MDKLLAKVITWLYKVAEVLDPDRMAYVWPFTLLFMLGFTAGTFFGGSMLLTGHGIVGCVVTLTGLLVNHTIRKMSSYKSFKRQKDVRDALSVVSSIASSSTSTTSTTTTTSIGEEKTS